MAEFQEPRSPEESKPSDTQVAGQPASSTAGDKPAIAPLLRWMIENKQGLGYVLIAGGLAIGFLTIVLANFRWEQVAGPIWVLGILLGLAMLLTGIERLYRTSTDDRPTGLTAEESARMAVLFLGGLSGLALTLGGAAFAYTWWNEIMSWLRDTGPVEHAGWRSLLSLGLLIAGLWLMFASLQIARTEERTNVGLRRLIYGYNAVLTALLLIAITAVVNVLVAVNIRAPLDFTRSANYTLAPQSVNILQNLPVPVEITMIHGFEDGFLEDETRTLLTLCREMSGKVIVKELSPEQDQQRYRDLRKQYSGIEPGSLLVVPKRGGDDKEHRIIPEKDLTQMPERFDPTNPTAHRFTGEDALMTVLRSLADDEKLPVIYVTQGNGELDLTDLFSGQGETGLGVLKRRLEQKRGFEIKPLTFNPLEPKVPDDAKLVIVPGPRRGIPPAAAKSLQDYMLNRGGKMIVFVDPVIAGGKMLDTGLEELLSQFGVGLPSQRIIALPVRGVPYLSPLLVRAEMNLRLAPQNVLVREFADAAFMLHDVRPLTITERAGPSPFQAQPLLMTSPRVTPAYGETRLDVEATRLVDEILTNRELLKKTAEQIEKNPSLPVMVGVVETKMGSPFNPHAAAGSAPKPRLIVFGSASFLSNRYMDERAGRGYFDLVASSIDWLREKPANIGISPKVRDTFTLTPRSGTERFRMLVFPLLLVTAGIVGLAAGVWIVRRR